MNPLTKAVPQLRRPAAPTHPFCLVHRPNRIGVGKLALCKAHFVTALTFLSTSLQCCKSHPYQPRTFVLTLSVTVGSQKQDQR